MRRAGAAGWPGRPHRARPALRARRAPLAAGVLAAVVVLGLAAHPATAFEPTTDAGIRRPGSWAIGLFSPTRVGIDERLELSTQVGWWVLLSPHLELRFAHLDSDRIRLTSSIALSTPTPAMRLLSGYLFPEWDKSDRHVGWFIVPELGIAASTGRTLVITGRVSVAAGIGVGDNAARPLDTYAPLELIFAPALDDFRVTTTAIADYGVLSWLRVRLELSLYAIGAGDQPSRSPWLVQVATAADVALGRWRLSAGVAYYNYDQRAQRVVRGSDGFSTRRAVRSNDVYPTIDVAYHH